jgi:hypothetical protein
MSLSVRHSSARTTVHWLVAVTGLLLGLLATSPEQASARSAPTVTFIGDSTMAGLKSADRSRILGVVPGRIEAFSCRRLIAKSCGRRVQPPNTMDVMRQFNGQLGDAVVIMAGYDDSDIGPAIDALVGEARKQGVRSVIWLTYRTGVPYIGPRSVSNDATFRRNNDQLRAATTRNPELILADWDTIGRAHPTWFTRDGIHITAAGSAGLATFLINTMQSVDVGRCRVGTEPAAVTRVVGPSRSADLPSTTPGLIATTPVRVLNSQETGTVRGLVPVVVPTAPGHGGDPVVSITVIQSCAGGAAIHTLDCPDPGTTELPTSEPVLVVAESWGTKSATTVLPTDACLIVSGAADVIVDLVGWRTDRSDTAGEPFETVVGPGISSLQSWEGAVTVDAVARSSGFVSVIRCGDPVSTFTLASDPGTARGLAITDRATPWCVAVFGDITATLRSGMTAA